MNDGKYSPFWLTVAWVAAALGIAVLVALLVYVGWVSVQTIMAAIVGGAR